MNGDVMVQSGSLCTVDYSSKKNVILVGWNLSCNVSQKCDTWRVLWMCSRHCYCQASDEPDFTLQYKYKDT